MNGDDHVVVTGGAGGIGLATVQALLDEGACVTVIDQSGEALAGLEEGLEDEDVLCLRADITDEDEMTDAFATATASFGPVTGLVNAAGLQRVQRFEDTSAETFRELLDINLVGALISAQLALDHMGGALAIVNVASVSGIRANAGRSAYGAAKAGLILLTQAMAVELGASGIRVNAVAPGAISTETLLTQHSVEERSEWNARVPQRRYGQSGEVAAAICFLLSDAASYINGHVLPVDGGFSVAGLPRTI